MSRIITFYEFSEKEVEKYFKYFLFHMSVKMERFCKKLKFSRLFFLFSCLMLFIFLLNVLSYELFILQLIVVFGVIIFLSIFRNYQFYVMKEVSSGYLIDDTFDLKNTSENEFSEKIKNKPPLLARLFLSDFFGWAYLIVDYISSWTSSGICENPLTGRNLVYLHVLKGRIKCILIAINAILLYFFWHFDFFHISSAIINQKVNILEIIPILTFFACFVFEPVFSICIFTSFLIFTKLTVMGLSLITAFLYLWWDSISRVLKPFEGAKEMHSALLTRESNFVEAFENTKDEILDMLLNHFFPSDVYDIYESSFHTMAALIHVDYPPFLEAKRFILEKYKETEPLANFGAILLRNYFLERFPKIKYARKYVKIRKGFVIESKCNSYDCREYISSQF